MQMTDTSTVIYNSNMKYKIQPGDILYIRVISFDENMNKLFNLEANTSTNIAINEANMFILGYLVNDTGYITLPVVGDILVKNLTIDESQATVKKNIDEYINDATVIVKLASFKITVLGEVKNPGNYVIYDNNLNLFEAIGKASDLTDYGNRTNVLVVRQTREGVKSYRASLLDKNILFSDFYYIQPNDIIYVEPVAKKAWRMNVSNITLTFSSITTLILVYNFLR
jgi:polysaccharide biosynthesis/export protein